MPDALYTAPLAAGLLCGGSVLVAGFGAPGADISRRFRQMGAAAGERLSIAAFRTWLAGAIELAGWQETSERLGVLAVAVAGCLALACGAIGLWLAPLGFAGGLGLCTVALNAAVERRRRRLAGELVPLLELFMLELSAGGSALGALGSVTVQVEGELATSLRRMLIASQVSGSQTFDSRLLEFSQRVRIPALATLATILGADRDFGTGASQGARALATDLRRAQRRDLITHSRKALNLVLLPAAVGVLLPFLAILMFPAVSVLQRSLR